MEKTIIEGCIERCLRSLTSRRSGGASPTPASTRWKVNDCRTGEALAQLSQVNAGIIRKDLARIGEARSALKQLPASDSWTSAARPPRCS